jgi:dihydropteroate synthase
MRTEFGGRCVEYDRPRIMGILNVTPDSFSDGGVLMDVRSAVRRAFEIEDQGADVLDIGGESTRPGSSPVGAAEEMRRIIPLLREVAPSIGIPVSVDTMKTEVAAACLEAGAHIINDVNGLRAEGMAELAASSGAPVVIVHVHGNPGTPHSSCMEGDAVGTVSAFLKERAEAAMDAGIRRDRIILDPGIGFGKTPDQNIEILQSSSLFSHGFPVLSGSSRKRFLGTLFPGMDRELASVRAARMAVDSGAAMVRVHDVALTRRVLRTM